jgi:hypothetical protein
MAILSPSRGVFSWECPLQFMMDQVIHSNPRHNVCDAIKPSSNDHFGVWNHSRSLVT